MDDLGIIYQSIEAFQKANPGKRAEIWEGFVFYGYTKEFFLFYTNFRLTCSKNERAFLDEIREKGEWMNSLKCLVVKKQDPNSHEQTGFLFQSDFTKTNLSELVEGKG